MFSRIVDKIDNFIYQKNLPNFLYKICFACSILCFVIIYPLVFCVAYLFNQHIEKSENAQNISMQSDSKQEDSIKSGIQLQDKPDDQEASECLEGSQLEAKQAENNSISRGNYSDGKKEKAQTFVPKNGIVIPTIPYQNKWGYPYDLLFISPEGACISMEYIKVLKSDGEMKFEQCSGGKVSLLLSGQGWNISTTDDGNDIRVFRGSSIIVIKNGRVIKRGINHEIRGEGIDLSAINISTILGNINLLRNLNLNR